MPIEFVTHDSLVSYLQQAGAGLVENDTALVRRLANGLIDDLIPDDHPGHAVDDFPVRVEAIALEAAARSFRNPDGAHSERGDDYAITRSKSTSEAGVYLTDDERVYLEQLFADPGSDSGRVRSVQLLAYDFPPKPGLPTP